MVWGPQSPWLLRWLECRTGRRYFLPRRDSIDEIHSGRRRLGADEKLPVAQSRSNHREGPMSDSDYEVRLKTTGRNDRCACGSGKKYKKCHLAEDERTRTATLKALEEEAMAKAKAARDVEGGESEADMKGADKSTRSTKRKKRRSGSKGRASDGKPKNIPRRGAV